MADRPALEEDPLCALRARVARLLDRTAPRRTDELDLAEAICALKWPNWPGYEGPVDRDLLRRALKGTEVDGDTLHWLGSHDLARACRAAGATPTVLPREPPEAG